MKIGVIQASSQKKINRLLYECTQKAVQRGENEVFNFGVLETEEEPYSYIETAFLVYLLLESAAVDFIVTGCSSGQGMMLACNSFPGVVCGYTPTPPDACLFGRINDGNAVSLPLGLHFGWSGELNLQYTLNALFEAPFGTGYPPQDAPRKQRDALLLKEIQRALAPSPAEVFSKLDRGFIKGCLRRKRVCSAVLDGGQNENIKQLLGEFIP